MPMPILDSSLSYMISGWHVVSCSDDICQKITDEISSFLNSKRRHLYSSVIARKYGLADKYGEFFKIHIKQLSGMNPTSGIVEKVYIDIETDFVCLFIKDAKGSVYVIQNTNPILIRLGPREL